MSKVATVSTPMRRAFGYVRVSVDEEAGNNASIIAQAAAIRDFASRDNIQIVKIFEEPDVSGRKLQRKQFDRMIAEATDDDRPVNIILVYSLSRFARRLLTQVVSEHKLTQAAVELVSLTEGSANDPTSRLMRSITAAINEKYALDASLFTRRDRRGNAKSGFWNGGPVPFGYKSVVAAIHGRKERMKLAVVEEEAAIVRLIFDLSLQGLDGQPMGTRSIAAYLNAQGYKLRTAPFRHSNVDGILTRDHYSGTYYDRTSPQIDRLARPDEAIAVACPQIVEPDIIAAVAARRAKAAPKVTPPRITNSPVLLTGLLRCGIDGCGAGLTIRSGKSGGYRYYTCAQKAQAAINCSSKPIREDALDRIVLDGLLERVLQPQRLKELLEAVLERSDASMVTRMEDLERVRRERVSAETRLGRLIDLVAEGLMAATDAIFAGRLAATKHSIFTLSETEKSLVRQLAGPSRQIDEAAIKRFANLLRAQILGENSAMRKAYVRLLIEKVTVNDNEIRIQGSKAALESAIYRGDKPLRGAVPSFDRKWCPGEDSQSKYKLLRILRHFTEDTNVAPNMAPNGLKALIAPIPATLRL